MSSSAAKAIGFPEFCFPCIHVVDQLRPVRYVSRDGADWIFSCGGVDHVGPADWGYAHTFHLLDADATLRELADLGPNGQAARHSPRSPWLPLTL